MSSVRELVDIYWQAVNFIAMFTDYLKQKARKQTKKKKHLKQQGEIWHWKYWEKNIKLFLKNSVTNSGKTGFDHTNILNLFVIDSTVLNSFHSEKHCRILDFL